MIIASRKAVAEPASSDFAPVVRYVLTETLTCGLLGTGIGLFQRPFPGWLFWFGVAALFSGWNFYGLSKTICQKISKDWSVNIAIMVFCGTQLRLCLTGVFVYIAFVRWRAPLAALLAGLSSALIFILISICCPSRRPQ